MAQETILFEREGGIRRLTLNRPDKLNSFNVQMHEEVAAALRSVAGDKEARVLVITGAGRAFSAGQDLGGRTVKEGEAPPDLGKTLEAYYNPLIRRITALEMPVIAAVNGVAAGAGANIAMACDLVIAAKSAKFIQAFAKIGLVPDSGGTWHLPRLVGMARAMGLALTAEPLSAEQAEEWGLVWKAVEDDTLTETVNGLAEHFASQPTKGLALTKKAIRAAFDSPLSEHLDKERDYQRAAGKTEDYREGVQAFMEKRTPEFKGK